MFNVPQRPFEVHVRLYGGDTFCATSHRTISGACRSLASLIGGRKYRVKNLDRAYVWCARDNRTYPLDRARELAKAGHFDGPAYR